MSPQPRIAELDHRGLRGFGLQMAAAIGVMFGLLLPWLFGRGWPTWPWWLAVTFALPALVAPMALRPVYRGWMRLARVLNRVMTPLILAVLFFGLFTPVALVMKLIGRDPLRRKLDPAADTYRIDVSDRPPSDLDRPF